MLVLTHLGATFHVVTVDLDEVHLALEARHRPDEVLAAHPDLLAATNAGLYHSPDRPVGLFVVDGVERAPLESGDGVGNFFLKPNGVFWLDEAGPHVAPAYAPSGAVRLATQSGPLLVSGGALHPAFRADSTNRRLRSAVGVDADGTVHLVLSDGEVTFWQLATLFRDVLGDCDALYLDGAISGLWGPDLPGGPDDVEYSGFLVVTPAARARP